jgi:Tol biopolymer transport system component
MQFGEITRLTSLPGHCLGAAFSPDGQRIAFSCSIDHRSDIYLVDRDGANLTRITNAGRGEGESAYYDPHFSPDGAHIVCGRADAYYEEINDLHLIDLQSGAGRPLTNTRCDFSHSFSPDGRHLLFLSTRKTLEDRCTCLEIFRMTWDGQERTQLTHTEYARTEGTRPPRNLHPRYSPDGDFIAFSSTAHDPRENRHEIYRMWADGSERMRLTYTQGNNGPPLWFPDSKHIAFTSSAMRSDIRKQQDNLYVVDVNGLEQHCLEENPAINHMHSFRPDGRFLAFDSNRCEVTERIRDNWEIFLRDMTTGEVHRMTDNAVSDREPLFSPDGTAILFQSQYEGKATLYYAEIQY